MTRSTRTSREFRVLGFFLIQPPHVFNVYCGLVLWRRACMLTMCVSRTRCSLANAGPHSSDMLCCGLICSFLARQEDNTAYVDEVKHLARDPRCTKGREEWKRIMLMGE